MRPHCWRDTRLAHALGFRCHTTELVRANLLAGFGPSYDHHRALVDRALAEMRAAQANNPYAAREKRAEDIVMGRPTSLPTGGIGAKPAPWYDDPANKEDLDRLLQHFGINPEEKH